MSGSYYELILAASLLILPFLYESSQAFRFYLKFFVYYGGVMLVAVVLIPVFCLRPRDVRNLLIASDLCKQVSKIIGLKWEVHGSEHMKKDSCFIIVSNHQSSIDILGMFEMWRLMDKCSVIAKKDLLYFWPFGMAAWLCGLIFISRRSPERAKKLMNDSILELNEKKTKLWIFPEGTRRNTGQIHEFKKGAFHLGISSQLPILPVVYSRYYFLDKKAKRFDAGKVVITILPPVETKGMKMDDLEKLMNNVHNKMSKAFNETSKQVIRPSQT